MTLITQTYKPESPLKEPGKLIRDAFRDLIASRELAWRLFVRDASAQYRQSMLGYVWAFLPPLAASLTFIVLNNGDVIKPGATSIPYPAFVMIGTLLWQVFADSCLAPLKTITASKSMLAKLNFPREGILISGIYMVIFNFLIRMVLVIAVLLYFHITPPLTVMLLPIGIAAIMAFGFMIGIILTPLGVLYQDVQNSLTMTLGFWMILTPVVYTSPQTGMLATIAKWNPVSPLILTTRDWLILGPSSSIPEFLLVSSATLILIFLGWMVFRIALPHLVARMGG